MRHPPIISRSESLQILKNDLRKLALEKHAAELSGASPEERAKIMARIDQDVENELRLRARKIGPGWLFH
jgi:hypothetical protein